MRLLRAGLLAFPLETCTGLLLLIYCSGSPRKLRGNCESGLRSDGSSKHGPPGAGGQRLALTGASSQLGACSGCRAPCRSSPASPTPPPPPPLHCRRRRRRLQGNATANATALGNMTLLHGNVTELQLEPPTEEELQHAVLAFYLVVRACAPRPCPNRRCPLACRRPPPRLARCRAALLTPSHSITHPLPSHPHPCSCLSCSSHRGRW